MNAWHHLNLSNKMEEDSIKFHTGQIKCKCSPLWPMPEEIEPIKINTKSKTDRSYQISLLTTQSNVYCDFSLTDASDLAKFKTTPFTLKYFTDNQASVTNSHVHGP